MLMMMFLIGCDPSDSLKEEAYESGWNSIYMERCMGIEKPLMIPDKYDDSEGSGILVDCYRSGAADAYADPNLCN